jgi:hypothetical protein
MVLAWMWACCFLCVLWSAGPLKVAFYIYSDVPEAQTMFCDVHDVHWAGLLLRSVSNKARLLRLLHCASAALWA